MFRPATKEEAARISLINARINAAMAGQPEPKSEPSEEQIAYSRQVVGAAKRWSRQAELFAKRGLN